MSRSLHYALMIRDAPWAASGGVRHSVLFARAVLNRGARINCAFFHADGVLCASSGLNLANEQADWIAAWREISQQHGLDLIICSASAIRRGVLTDHDAGKQNKDPELAVDGFRVGGLALWVDAMCNADRVLRF